MVLTAGWMGAEFTGGATATEEEPADYWRQLEDSGTQVIAIRDAPSPSQDVMAPDRVVENRDRLRGWGRPVRGRGPGVA